MIPANSGAGGTSPRKCSICGRELNLFNCASIQWIPPEIVENDYGEIDFLCPNCFLMLRATYNAYVSQFQEDDSYETS